MTSMKNGSAKGDKAFLGSGRQEIDLGSGRDHIIIFGDAGEPDPAQTDGANGRITPPLAANSANDVIRGGAGADQFEWRALLDATEEVKAEHRNADGTINWRAVTGENDNVHDHWVEGFGLDTVMDFSREEGDTITIKGHTATLKSIEYGKDDGGSYSMLTIISQQGNGGAGGANTATGAHDEDGLGQIKIYGDKVLENHVRMINTNDGIDQLYAADAAYGMNMNGVTREVFSDTDGDHYDGSLYKQSDHISIGRGRQDVDGGGGNDVIYSYSDGGEPDPAQTNGAGGRVNAPVADGMADDVIKGGQGRDTFAFRLLLNAKDEIIEKYTRDDGSINWRGVAGENDNVHDHWVEGIGNDVILDFSNQDNDKIDIRGHTVEIASIEYGEDDGGDYSMIHLRSQQGNGGAGGENTATGAHDEDPLGSIKVYGDKVTEGDIKLRANVFDGVDQLDDITVAAQMSPADNDMRDVSNPTWGLPNPEAIDVTFEGTDRWDKLVAGSGSQTVLAGKGNDRIISYGDAGEPDPAQTVGADGRATAAVPSGGADDVLTGGAGRDKFEFHALLNATAEVIAQHTLADGSISWRGVAGENDNVHDHWVEGFGNDVITDYSKSEGDKIIIRGHTVEIADVTYDEDEGGTFTFVSVRSQQGNGGAGGANTETGSHDEDSLGTIKVYGDKVTKSDIKVQAAGVFDGADMLAEADRYLEANGGVSETRSNEHGVKIITSASELETRDWVYVGSGSQTVSTGAGRDQIWSYADAGEPDPAQTDGADGRIYDPVDPSMASDTISGGQGKDTFTYNMLLNATDAVLARHTKDDGSINWRKVAGENDAVHDHWVEGIGNDVLTDFSKQDGDKIVARGHTVEIASITYGDDDGGDFSLVTFRSQQGNNGGAHDEDALGSLKVYGDQVTKADIKVQAAGIFDGVDIVDGLGDLPNYVGGTRGGDMLGGTASADNIHGGHGHDTVNAGAGDDFVFGGAHNDVLSGADGNDWLEGGWGRDTMDGGSGEDILVSTGGKDMMTGGTEADTFMFMANTFGGQILDWQSGTDMIDLSRLDNVDGFNDLDITQTGSSMALLRFDNDRGREVTVQVSSEEDFVLMESDFLV